MVNLVWVGAASTDSTVLGNWLVEGTPNPPTVINTSDNFIFGNEAGDDCLIQQSLIGGITTDENFARNGRKLIFNKTTHSIQTTMDLAADQTLKFTQSTTNITFTGGFSSGAPNYNYPVIYRGDVAYDTGGSAKTTVTYTLNNSNSAGAYLTYGDLPNIVLATGKWTWNIGHSTVAGSHSGVLILDENDRPYSKCCKLSILSPVTFDNEPINHDEYQHQIQVTGDGVSSGQHFSCAAAVLDFSNAKLTIDAKNTQQLPCTNDVTNFGSSSGFTAILEDVVVGNANSSGKRCFIPEGLTLECASLEIKSGSFLYGGGTNLQTGAKSHIHVIEKPKIRGTWNFEETSDGIYSSIGGVSSISAHTAKFDNVDIVDKLTVGGLIDPTGLELTPVAANPGGTAANTLWLNSGDSNKLYHGSSEVASGGGGGGTVDVVSNVATSRILGRVTGGSGDSEELTAAQVRTLINVEDGADVTDATNVTAAGALMDSEVTNLAQVKAFDSADYATAAQGAKADSALQPGSAVAPGDPVSSLANDTNYLAAGDPVSPLTNDAGYLTQLQFCQWNDISADITATGVATNTLINNWSYTTGASNIRDAMSSGVWTCTAELAGTYLIISKIQFKTGTLAESAGVNYKLQCLNYKNTGGGTPSSGTLSNFARHMNSDFYIGYILETQFILTIADTDTFGVYAKIATSSGSGNFKIASGSNAMTSLTMIKIA